MFMSDTQAAERLYKELDEGIYKLRDALTSHQTQERFAVGLIREFEREAERRGLKWVAKQIRADFRKYQALNGWAFIADWLEQQAASPEGEHDGER
jgi:hypothetical protein